MIKRRFRYVEQYALWRAYDGRCFYCEKPLVFREMTIDHIVPEWLIEHPDKLRKLRQEYDIDTVFPGFQVNDFTNWAPAHLRCNTRKGADIDPKSLTLFRLQNVQRRLGRVRHELEVLCRNRGRANLFGSLSAAIENKHLAVHEVREFVAEVE